MKKEKETIVMEESTFIKRHAKKIIIAGGIATTAGVLFILKKHGIELQLMKSKFHKAKGIALRSLIREKAGAENEIAEKMEYINNLDPNIKINIFENIPRAKARVAELEIFIKEINADIAELQRD